MHIGVFKKLMFVAAYVLPLLLAERPACAEVLDKSEVAASGGESSQKNIDIKNVDPDISSAEELKKTPLTLQNAIDAAMRGNLNLIYTRFEPEKSSQDVKIEESVFDPQLYF